MRDLGMPLLTIKTLQVPQQELFSSKVKQIPSKDKKNVHLTVDEIQKVKYLQENLCII